MKLTNVFDRRTHMCGRPGNLPHCRRYRLSNRYRDHIRRELPIELPQGKDRARYVGYSSRRSGFAHVLTSSSDEALSSRYALLSTNPLLFSDWAHSGHKVKHSNGGEEALWP